MPQPTKSEKLAAIEAAYDYVHTDVEHLIKQVAGEHAVVNMGMTLEDQLSWYVPKPDDLLYSCFNNFLQQSESDEMERGTMQEYKSWVKQAKKDVALVKKAKLPLTARNVRAAFLHEGPFKK